MRCGMLFYSKLKIYTTLGYIVSQILSNLGTCVSLSHRQPFVYIFNYKMFHQEALVDTTKMLFCSFQIELFDKGDCQNSLPSENSNCIPKLEILNSLAHINDEHVVQSEWETSESHSELTMKREEYVNPRGIRFTSQTQDEVPLVPYNLAYVRELFRFLIGLCNPTDKQNTDVMIHLGLILLTVALEIGADNIGNYPSLMVLVKNELCRYLFMVLLKCVAICRNIYYSFFYSY